jgi:hypothetical protein
MLRVIMPDFRLKVAAFISGMNTAFAVNAAKKTMVNFAMTTLTQIETGVMHLLVKK